MSKRVNATHYEAIPPQPKRTHDDARIHAIIETPKHSRHKYALNNEYGIIAFHEVMPDSMQWPYDYGFVPQTLADDGDPLDVLVMTQNGLFSGCMIEVRVLGAVLQTKDGTKNPRLIAVPKPSAGAPQPTDDYHDIFDIPPSMRDDVVAFLKSYSQRQGHEIVQTALIGNDDAMKLVKQKRKAFKKQR